MTGVRLRQLKADLLSSFWLRPAVMTVAAVVLSAVLVEIESLVTLPDWLGQFVYAGDMNAARDVLGVIAAASIGVAGTSFSVTVAALTMATSQMGPRLLRHFTRDAGNQYALGTLVATFAFALVALRGVHSASGNAFVPHIAVTVALLLAGISVGMLIWFIQHIASSINLDHVVALVRNELTGALQALPRRREPDEQMAGTATGPPAGPAAPLSLNDCGYMRVLDDDALADWATEHNAVLRLHVRPGGFVFPRSTIGEVVPASLREAAEEKLARLVTLGATRNVEQDIEYAVRQMVEVGLRALSTGVNDPFTVVAVLDQLGAALCDVTDRSLPDGRTWRGGVLRVERPATDYEGLVDAMLHMLREFGSGVPAVMIRMLEMLAAVGAVEQDPKRRQVLRRHADLAHELGKSGSRDPTARRALDERHAAALHAMVPSAGREAA